jgi:hypothetical protein
MFRMERLRVSLMQTKMSMVPLVGTHSDDRVSEVSGRGPAYARPHDADPRQHRWAVLLGDQDQSVHRGLPFRRVVFCLGQLGDVERGVAEREQRLSARQYDWIEKSLIPRHGFIPSTHKHVRDYPLTGRATMCQNRRK